jgi:hypothetical protein
MWRLILNFVSADIDLDTCRHYLLGFRRVDNKGAIRFYVSNRYRMLKISQRIFGGYDRLGEDVEHKLGPSRAVEQVIVRKEKEVSPKIATLGTTNTPDVIATATTTTTSTIGKKEELHKEYDDSDDNETNGEGGKKPLKVLEVKKNAQ